MLQYASILRLACVQHASKPFVKELAVGTPLLLSVAWCPDACDQLSILTVQIHVANPCYALLQQ